ncbi:MAG TPA: aldehyde dehydrogenase family protein [Blastocatellia bacterium]|nr:aldehyde dehydrogenase family protein [Blastocatellia bacterium]
MAKPASKVRTREYKNYIGGKWVDPASGTYLENRNPADTRDLVGRFPASQAEDVNRAVEAAADALVKWRKTPAPRRAEMLFRAGEILIRRKEEFACAMTREMGKVIKEARGDVQEAIDMTYFIAGEGRRLHGFTTKTELPNKFAMCVREPIGIAGLITPWNFPMAIPSWKIVPALVCGNTVVIKPAEDTPLSTYNLVAACDEAGIPPGVLNVVSGLGEYAGAALVSHPGVGLISFTGSTEVGRQVGAAAALTDKICSLEMGGKNVVMIMDDADLNLALDGVLWGAFGTSGQRCTAASRVVVHRKVAKKFIGMLVDRANHLKLGNGLDEKTDVGPVINQDAADKIMGYIDTGKRSDGAKMLCGGRRATKGDLKYGYYVEPTVFAQVEPGMRIAQEEIFGPVLSVIECRGFEDAIAIANGVRYGLSASIYTADVNQAYKAMEEIRTGIFYVNASTIGAEVQLPFGGTKATGNGHREGGTQVLDVFSEWKAVYIDYSGKLQRAQIDV